jgi:hypothetical protein
MDTRYTDDQTMAFSSRNMVSIWTIVGWFHITHLSAKFQAHINVEICSTVTAVKYLYKYVYKGSDKIMAAIQDDPNSRQPVNELQRFKDARYISSGEAAWRLFHSNINDRSPAIQRLAVHLPQQNSVVYTPGRVQDALEHSKNTTLTAWFIANQEYPHAKTIPYHLFPEHFTWNSASPAEGERYYLQLMLHHTPGCTSFEDIRRLDNGEVASTFKTAALHRGFLQDDSEWRRCLEEASVSGFPRQIQQLFATILIFCDPTEPEELFKMFLHHMTDDVVHAATSLNLPTTDEQLQSHALFHIQQLLHQHGKDLSDYPNMPTLPENYTGLAKDPDIDFNPTIEKEKAEANAARLNADQKAIYEEVIQAVLNQQSKVLFIDGPGGTGKTFLYNTIIHKVRSLNLTTIATASSGITAELLQGG